MKKKTIFARKNTCFLNQKDSAEQCLVSSELLIPHPLSAQTRQGVRGWGVNISEDARHWIGLLQYNQSTVQGLELQEKIVVYFIFLVRN